MRAQLTTTLSTPSPTPFFVKVIPTSSENGPLAVLHIMDVAEHYLLNAFWKRSDNVQQIV
eukprot:CAMPEP_0194341322 /NCGR_PEP_ID=MMETSP0171-20130528/89364_1 /TAXON_ID=218684 /ORGANISM="Corethron pennatum, Strain L29A3" /LENGTH=59 /DNA_ID=CAMNT_0039106629 /DNA_START=114 /DNA_END=290 /DNA_ORIENTATION=-